MYRIVCPIKLAKIGVFKVLKAVVTCAALRGLEPPLGEEEPPLGDTWPLVTVAAGGFFEFFFCFSCSANHCK